MQGIGQDIEREIDQDIAWDIGRGTAGLLLARTLTRYGVDEPARPRASATHN